MKTLKINNWSYISVQPHIHNDIITPDITITDPTGQQKTLTQFNFLGNSDQFIQAVKNFFQNNTSFADAGLDDRIFLASGFFNKFIA